MLVEDAGDGLNSAVKFNYYRSRVELLSSPLMRSSSPSVSRGQAQAWTLVRKCALGLKPQS